MRKIGKIRKKIFKADKYPQGDFSDLNKLKEIVENTKDGIKTIFAHTSKWVGGKKQPVEVGEFSNVTLEGDEIFADFEFNEKGQTYYNDGIIRGLSVEIKDNMIDKVAALPIGVNPAIDGAEFEYKNAFIVPLEFELMADIENMSLEDKLDTIKALAKSIGTEHRDTFRAIAYEFELIKEVQKLPLKEELGTATQEEKKEVYETLKAEFAEKVEPKTEEQIRAEVAKEFELKATEKELKAKLEKLPPSMRGIAEFAIEKACTVEESEKTYEFEADGEKVQKTKIVEFGEMLDNLKGLPTSNLSSEFQNREDVAEKSPAEIAKEKLAPYKKK